MSQEFSFGVVEEPQLAAETLSGTGVDRRLALRADEES